VHEHERREQRGLDRDEHRPDDETHPGAKARVDVVLDEAA
jgi:hypothetical protein